MPTFSHVCVLGTVAHPSALVSILGLFHHYLKNNSCHGCTLCFCRNPHGVGANNFGEEVWPTNKVARRPWAPRIVLVFAIKALYVLDSWKTSCPRILSGVLENSWTVVKLFIIEILITFNIQESILNNVIEQNNPWKNFKWSGNPTNKYKENFLTCMGGGFTAYLLSLTSKINSFHLKILPIPS